MNTIRRGVFVMLLALAVACAPLALASEGEKPATDEQAAEVMRYAEALEDLIRHPKLHRYVSDDGANEKWICSLEPEIDGLKWTEETKDFDFSFEQKVYKEHLDKYECPVEEYHQHLYGFMPYGEGTVTKEQEEYLILTILSDNDIEWAKDNIDYFPYLTKSPVVMTYTEQEHHMMIKLHVWPTIFRCIESDLYMKQIADGTLSDFLLLGLSIKDEGDYYIVDEKLITCDELAFNATEYPYVPYILKFSDTYQPKTNYKVYKKDK